MSSGKEEQRITKESNSKDKSTRYQKEAKASDQEGGKKEKEKKKKENDRGEKTKEGLEDENLNCSIIEVLDMDENSADSF